MTFVDPNYDIAMAGKYIEQVTRAKQTPPEWLQEMAKDGESFRGGSFNDDSRSLSKPGASVADSAPADDW